MAYDRFVANGCYQYVHDQVLKGDTIYQSCDRSVCTAVRWSGVDDNFPGGNVLVIEDYLVSSPRWTQIDWGGDVTQLQPGDILVRKTSLKSNAIEDPGDTTHVAMYIGNYLAQKYGNFWSSSTGVRVTIPNTTVIYHGSFGERSPGLGSLYPDLQAYKVFRCTAKMGENTSKYSNVAYSP